MMPIEFLFFALYFVVLSLTARRRGTDGSCLGALRVWTVVQGVLFVAFTVLVYAMSTVFLVPFGAIYLASLGLALYVTISMRETVEAG